MAGANRVRAALLAAGGGAGDADRVSALALAGWLEASAGNLDRAAGELDDALRIAQRSGSELLVADVHRHRAFLRLQQGDPAGALAEAEQGISVELLQHRPWEQAAGLLLAASGAMMLGDIAGAARSADAALLLLEPIGDAWGMTHGTAMLGAIAQAAQQFDDAAGYLDRAARMSHQLGFLGQEAYHLTRLGRVQQQAGHPEPAAETLLRAIDVATDDGDLRMRATASINLARVLRGTERHELVTGLLEQADEFYRRSGKGDGARLATVLLISISHPEGERAAQEHLEEILEQARSADDGEVQVLALDALARMAAQLGAGGVADDLLLQADRVSAITPTVLDAIDRVDAALARQLLSTRLPA